MADKNQNNATENDSDIEVDPITQGADRVQKQQEDEGRLDIVGEDDTQDTQTRSNIHLGGRSDEGEGSNEEEGAAFPTASLNNIEGSGSPVQDSIDSAEAKLSGFLSEEEASDDDISARDNASRDNDSKSSGTSTSALEFEAVAQAGPLNEIGVPENGEGGQTTQSLSPEENQVQPQILNDENSVTDEVNVNPVAVDDVGTVDENETLTLNVLSNDTDADNDNFFITDVSIEDGLGAAAHDGRNITFNPGSAYDYLAEGETANVEISYEISDGQGGTDTATATVTVTGSNDGPVAAADSFTGTEDSVITGNVLSNDSDVDGDSLSVVAETITTAQGGTVDINADGTFSYNPAADFNGTDSFSYTLSDGTLVDTGSVSLEVSAVNDGPVAGAVDLGATAEDTSVTFSAADLLANSSDVDGDSLSVTAVSVAPEFGTVSDNGDGSYSFTPAENYNGDDVALSFEVSDGTSTASATASIDVTAVADAPILTVGDSGGIPVTLKISGDHYDPNNVEDVGAGSPQFQVFVNGEAVLVDGESTFTVDAERGDWELFRFEVEPGTDINSVEVKFVNDAWDGKNDSDGDGIIGEDRNLIVDKINIGGEADQNGDFVGGYTLEAEDAYYDKTGTDGSETMFWTGTMSFDTSDIDMGPVASGSEDTAIALNINAELSDASESLSITISGVPDGAVLSAGENNGDGSWSLTPDQLDGLNITPPENYAGSFDLTVSATSTDGGDSAATSTTLSVSVSAVNDGPAAGAVDLGATAEDTSVTFSAADLLANSSDVDGDSLSVTAVSVAPEFGTVSDNGDGSYSFTPAENYNGDDVTLSFEVSDGTSTASATASLDVTAVNDGPVAVADGPTPDITEVLTGKNGLYDISAGGEVTIDANYISSDAGFNNSHGYYIADSDGNPIGGAIIQDNVKDFGAETITINTDDYPDGVTLGFFMIPNGDNNNITLADGDQVTFQEIDGNWTAMSDGVPLSGTYVSALFSDPLLNPGGVDQLIDSAGPGNQNWEDTPDGGDLAYDDINMDVTVSLTSNSAGGSDNFTGTEDGAITGNVLGNDTDVDGDTLSVVAETIKTANGGTVDIAADGTFSYNPAADFNGTDSFSYTLSDGTLVDTGSVSLEVSAVNDGPAAPIDNNNTGNTVVEGAAAGTAVGITALSSDIDGDSVTYSLLDDAGGLFAIDGVTGVVTVADGAVVDHETAANHNIIIQASDGTDTSTQTFTIDVIDAMDAVGTAGNDFIVGGDGDDELAGGLGADLIEGGLGNDTLNYNADDTWSGKYAALNVETGERVSLRDDNRSSDVFDGGEGYDTLQGTDGNDALFLDDSYSGFVDGAQARIQNIEEIDMGAGDDIVDMTSNSYTYDQGVIVKGGEGNDTLWTSTGDDTLIGGTGNDSMFGGEGSDIFVFGADEGNDTVDGGSGWTDTIQLNDMGDDAQAGWTLTLDKGSTISSTDEDANEMLLSDDASGTITFDDGNIVEFEGIEKIVW
ncbi:MAG: tandem-95 repeat protein [Emcibacter sp.]|nr:tandem-95 repeat protein [Emcibacter sp.]